MTWLNADQALACSLAVKQEDIEVKHTLIPLLSGYIFTEVLKDVKIASIKGKKIIKIFSKELDL